jgi:hypothetical protein
MTTSLEEALNTVSQLTLEQQTMLIEIIQNRLIEARRQDIAADAKASIAAFHRGEWQAQSAESAIAELQQMLDTE